MTTTVHNIRTLPRYAFGGRKYPNDGVHIARPSIWGNPFQAGIAPGERRADVIRKYEEWIKTQPELLSRLGELRGKKLFCWCAPLPCHGDVLARMADSAT